MTPKAILITGASSGIGRAAAKALAQKGHLLALAARRVARLETLAREIQDLHGVPPLVLPTDVSNHIEIKSMIKKTYDHFGRIDVVVNNAGVLFMQDVLEMPREEMRTLMETNFWGPLEIIREAAPVMEKLGGGHIINVGSGVSRRGLPYMSVYSASKWALAGLTEAMRLEWSPRKIKFTMVYPGGVETEMPAGVDRAKLPANYPKHIKGISAERAARAIVKAVEKQPLEIYVPWWVRPGIWLSVLAPALADRIISKVRTPWKK